jgi:hypothetical protein
VRLDLQSGPDPVRVGGLMTVSGVIDWSTIRQFSTGLTGVLPLPGHSVVVDFTGLLSWSAEAQVMVVGAILEARLRGGELAIVGLQSVPAWQARDSGLPGTDPAANLPAVRSLAGHP